MPAERMIMRQSSLVSTLTGEAVSRSDALTVATKERAARRRTGNISLRIAFLSLRNPGLRL
jgi:hypothetical protein